MLTHRTFAALGVAAGQSLLGISDDDLDALLRDPEALGGDGPVEGEGDVPEPPVTPVSVPGKARRKEAQRLGLQ